MYLVQVEVKESPISGKGVFCLSDISKGTVVWKFCEGYDQVMSVEKYHQLPGVERAALDRVAYLSSVSNCYIYPPQGDPANFTNHDDPYNLSVKFNQDVSPEPHFVANRDIVAGEELTNYYPDFDAKLKDLAADQQLPEWMNKN